MPFSYAWQHLARVQGVRAAEEKLDSLRTINAYANMRKRCSMCPTNHDHHQMRYRIWFCNSSTCKEDNLSCTYWLKVLWCLQTDINDFLSMDNTRLRSGRRIQGPSLVS
ncbi:hypothetical protein GN244_ATG21030 [Phytophthora infestans]|uniref:Uncharacterized protein n=1 Tax=Phytophthora infestans TaxID=4787 RepID=A0A833WH98_PHYIN|nr:hypothetical protein GN244_ATG21030 [Phytophthora infestans]